MSDEQPRTHLDLFSGIGGFSIAAERCGFRTVQFVERNEYCQKVLGRHWPNVPIHSDIKNFKADEWAGKIELLTGGVPCSPSSVAGKMLGSDDQHSRWCWPDAIRCISDTRPRYALLENPSGLLSVDGGRAWAGILSDIHSIGYDLLWETMGSYAVGAPHKRTRIWLLATDSQRGEWGGKSHGGPIGRVGRECQPLPWDRPWEDALREFRGMDDGTAYTSHRVDTIRNAITPQVAEIIIKNL